MNNNVGKRNRHERKNTRMSQQNEGCIGNFRVDRTWTTHAVVIIIACPRLWITRRRTRAAGSPIFGRFCTTRWCTGRTAYQRNGPTLGVSAACSWTRTFCRTRRIRTAGGPHRGWTARVVSARAQTWKNVRWE